ncbi:MAG: mycothiol synthase [Thermomicrobiales bacterium]|jgi:ribosomal protein S18 acetylase RimI-like enzyme|nr:mycothiol synthase [Thermomicrobiales bacterium]
MTPNPYVTARPSAGERNFGRMYDLAATTLGDALHVADLPWRLTSPSARVPERVRLWEDADGELVAWAALQFPSWHCLDYVVRPDARTAELESAVLTWACARLEAEAAGRDGRLPFYVSARERDSARIAAIERAGFARENWGYVHLIRDLDQPIPEPEPPPGFVVRSLAGEREVDAYVAAHRAAFGTANMTADWRRATLRDPQYVPALDLVAIAPDGTLVGFCVCWITPSLGGRRVAQVEPLGVLPAFQRTGLGRALLLEGLRRARAHGADRMDVNAESNNAASQGAYEAVGFRPAYEAPFFLRSFG